MASNSTRRRRPVIAADQAHDGGFGGELADIAGYVGRAARIVGFAGDVHHWDGRFRGNARDLAPDELVKHKVADDEDALAGEPGDEAAEARGGGFR